MKRVWRCGVWRRGRRGRSFTRRRPLTSRTDRVPPTHTHLTACITQELQTTPHHLAANSKEKSNIISTVHPGIHPELLRSFAIRPTKALSSLYRAANSPENATSHRSSRSRPVALKELLAPWVYRRYLQIIPQILHLPPAHYALQHYRDTP